MIKQNSLFKIIMARMNLILYISVYYICASNYNKFIYTHIYIIFWNYSFPLWFACMRAKSLQSCPTLCDSMTCSPSGSSVHGDSPSSNTGVGCHALLQGIFPTQGLNPGLPCCRQILYRCTTKVDNAEIISGVSYFSVKSQINYGNMMYSAQ